MEESVWGHIAMLCFISGCLYFYLLIKGVIK